MTYDEFDELGWRKTTPLPNQRFSAFMRTNDKADVYLLRVTSIVKDAPDYMAIRLVPQTVLNFGWEDAIPVFNGVARNAADLRAIMQFVQIIQFDDAT